MAEEAAGAAAPASSDGGEKLALIVALVNTVALLAAMGLLAYTKLVFKRPAITEDSERVRLAALHETPPPPLMPTTVTFDPATMNISPTPANPKAADGTDTQILGKLHYATIGFTLEIRDADRKDAIEALRPKIMDRILTIMGHKTFQELTTVQGRYILRTQIIDLVNQLANESEGENAETSDGVATGAYFTQFMVQ